MKILFLSQRVPEPPNKGDKIRSCHLMRRLALRHEVHVGCLLDDEEDRPHVATVEGWAASVAWRPRRPAESVMRGATGVLSGAPISVGWFHSGGLAADVADLLARHEFDVAVAYCSSMGGYLKRFRGPRVIDFVDVDSEKWKQYSRKSGFPRNAVYAMEHRLLRAWERRLVREFDRSVVVSEAERDVLATFVDPSRVEVVSIGVDLDGLRRSTPRAAGPELVFVGALDYFPNAEGISWFAREAMPRIRDRLPGASLRIVGRRPGSEVRELSDLPGVKVVGEVDDVRPDLWRAAVAVVPLRIAQGLQTKVLEAMAAGVPVVATPASVRAFEARDGVWREADTPDEWATEIARLVENPAEADAQAGRALQLVHERHSWDAIAREYEAVLEAAVAEHRETAATGGRS